MEIDVSSLTVRLKSLVNSGLTSRSESDTYRGEKSSDLSETRKIPVSRRSEKQVELNSLGKHKVDYQINQETDEVIIRILDTESDEVVQQIPGDEFLRLFSRINDFNKKIIDESV
jgi:flagellar protein FlaG